ncbi:MAG: hypothetical protein R2849_21375 [Thermomicrobiales bacterium]
MAVGDLPYGAHLIIAEVVRIHVRDDLMLERNRIDLQKLTPSAASPATGIARQPISTRCLVRWSR